MCTHVAVAVAIVVDGGKAVGVGVDGACERAGAGGGY